MKIGKGLRAEDVHIQRIVAVCYYIIVENVKNKAGLANSSFGFEYNIITIDNEGNQLFRFFFPVTEEYVWDLYSGIERIE